MNKAQMAEKELPQAGAGGFGFAFSFATEGLVTVRAQHCLDVRAAALAGLFVFFLCHFFFFFITFRRTIELGCFDKARYQEACGLNEAQVDNARCLGGLTSP